MVQGREVRGVGLARGYLVLVGLRRCAVRESYLLPAKRAG